MNKKELKEVIKQCILEVKVKTALRGLILESIEEIKIEKEKSLCAKMEQLAKEVSNIKKEATVELDDAKRYNVCYCDPHHFKIHPMTDDNFTVEYFKNKTDRQKKFNLTYEELKEYITEILKKDTTDYVQSAYNKVAEDSKDKESKKEESPKSKEKAKDEVTNKDDLPDAPLKSVEKITKQVDHKSKDPNYNPPKLPKNQQKLVIKYTKSGKQKKK